jgi:protein-L-isoaspartate(D-aspartate) O-methyltransferase
MAGEPGAARARLADALRRLGVLASPEVEEAFRAVPRHVFLPDVPSADAYSDRAFVIKKGEQGQPLSSSSQPAMMAIMLGQLGISPGDRVLEIGTGTGYNAALMALLAGERGLVVTVDIDPGIAARARENLAAGSAPRGAAPVIVITGDGGFGAAGYAPYDKVIVTAGAWDIAPAWLCQAGPGGRLVLPLSLRGIQLSVTLEADPGGSGAWRSGSVAPCGFIRMTGAFGSPESPVAVGPQPGMLAQVSDGSPIDAGALHAALAGPAADVPTGVRVRGLAAFFTVNLWMLLSQPGLTRVRVVSDKWLRTPLVAGGFADPAQASGFGIAALCPAGWPRDTPQDRRPGRDEQDEERRDDERLRQVMQEYRNREFEVAVRGFGPGGTALARRLASHVAGWEQRGRPGPGEMSLAAYPLGGLVPDGAGEIIIGRPHTRFALSWRSPAA